MNPRYSLLCAVVEKIVQQIKEGDKNARTLTSVMNGAVQAKPKPRIKPKGTAGCAPQKENKKTVIHAPTCGDHLRYD